MINKVYFKILIICFVLAAPAAWYAVNRWLENFAYQNADVLVGISACVYGYWGDYGCYDNISDLAGGE